MPTIEELYTYLDAKIPRSLSCEWDNDGLMLCPDGTAEAKKLLLALDATEEVASYAAENGYDVIVTHHPMIFSPLRSLNGRDPIAKRALALAAKGISVMSFHTRLDALEGGVNDALAAKLGVKNTVPFGPEGEKLGRVGELDEETEFSELCKKIAASLPSPCVSAIGAGKKVRRVALLGGGGKDFVESAIACGADAFVTGEVTYNVMLGAHERGLCLAAAGHYHTERPVLSALGKMIAEKFPSLEMAEYPMDTEIFTVK